MAHFSNFPYLFPCAREKNSLRAHLSDGELHAWEENAYQMSSMIYLKTGLGGRKVTSVQEQSGCKKHQNLIRGSLLFPPPPNLDRRPIETPYDSWLALEGLSPPPRKICIDVPFSRSVSRNFFSRAVLHDRPVEHPLKEGDRLDPSGPDDLLNP